MFRGERALYQVDDISITEGIIHFVEIEDLRNWNVDGNAQINVGNTDIDGRRDLSPETTPTGHQQ